MSEKKFLFDSNEKENSENSKAYKELTEFSQVRIVHNEI